MSNRWKSFENTSFSFSFRWVVLPTLERCLTESFMQSDVSRGNRRYQSTEILRRLNLRGCRNSVNLDAAKPTDRKSSSYPGVWKRRQLQLVHRVCSCQTDSVSSEEPYKRLHLIVTPPSTFPWSIPHNHSQIYHSCAKRCK